MKSLVGLILALIFISLLSCKKEQASYVTIKDFPEKTLVPKPYFPVYPGSWWKYVINRKDTITRRTSKNYVQHRYIRYWDYNEDGIYQPVYSKWVLAPFYCDEPIYQYDEIRYSTVNGTNYYYRSPLLRDKVGQKFTRGYYNHKFPHLSETVTVEDKYFNGTDTVIVLIGRWFSDLLMPHHVYEEFAKDKGLIKRYHVLNSNSDTIYSEELIDHYINQF